MSREIPKQHTYNLPRPCQRSPYLKPAIWYFSKEAKELIAQVKLSKKEQNKQEIISEIDLEKDKDKGLNETVYEDYNETQSLRIQIHLLKQLNCELQDKNRILNELLTK